jgi:hypothetical protein
MPLLLVVLGALAFGAAEHSVAPVEVLPKAMLPAGAFHPVAAEPTAKTGQLGDGGMAKVARRALHHEGFLAPRASCGLRGGCSRAAGLQAAVEAGATTPGEAEDAPLPDPHPAEIAAAPKVSSAKSPAAAAKGKPSPQAHSRRMTQGCDECIIW